MNKAWTQAVMLQNPQPLIKSLHLQRRILSVQNFRRRKMRAYSLQQEMLTRGQQLAQMRHRIARRSQPVHAGIKFQMHR
jgi:hypothetical protein